MTRRSILAAATRRFDRQPPDDVTVTRLFHRLYYESAARTWYDTSWLGTPVQKCPLDLWVYQELLFRLRPAVVVETGTFEGGSALFLASCMDLIGHGRILTVDVDDRPGRPAHPRVTYLAGSSVDERILERVRDEVRGEEPVMVILDSDHRRDHVLAELGAYSPLVTPGSYLVVEDTNINGHPVLAGWGPGPHEAVDEFLGGNPGFSREPASEKFYLSFNPGGFLRRSPLEPAGEPV